MSVNTERMGIDVRTQAAVLGFFKGRGQDFVARPPGPEFGQEDILQAVALDQAFFQPPGRFGFPSLRT